jgi:hypothetical protein
MKEHWKYIVIFVFGVILGFYVCHTWFPRTVTVSAETVKVETQVEYKDRTVISYVPKTSVNDSDVEMTKALPQITVSVNGTQHSFEGVQGETQKFDKGKLVVDQSSTLKVDVSADVEAQIERGINKAFADQAKKPKYRIGLEGSIDGNVKTEGNLRISRQADAFDVDARANQSKQSISATWWF